MNDIIELADKLAGLEKPEERFSALIAAICMLTGAINRQCDIMEGKSTDDEPVNDESNNTQTY